MTAEVEAVFGLRSRYDPDSGNGIYVVFLLKPVAASPWQMARSGSCGIFTSRSNP